MIYQPDIYIWWFDSSQDAFKIHPRTGGAIDARIYFFRYTQLYFSRNTVSRVCIAGNTALQNVLFYNKTCNYQEFICLYWGLYFIFKCILVSHMESQCTCRMFFLKAMCNAVDTLKDKYFFDNLLGRVFQITHKKKCSLQINLNLLNTLWIFFFSLNMSYGECLKF